MKTKSPSDADRYIGSRIRARRLMIGMSQEKLGDALGLTFQQVQKYEKGTNRVGAGRLQQIGTILRVSVAYFYEGLPGDQSVIGSAENAVAIAMNTPEGLRLAKAFTALENSQIRRKVVELVEAISPDS
ncbi:helix-turn-helix domain-containing protein [Microvirga sp. 2TAF3]|uniref:helix-turn-helix domain-containing protein n=1 Tax=Microvirga sp. 2TAF3 TaxID=3233014 RepID=UPI003F97BFE9